MIYPWLNIICAMTKHDQVIGYANELSWPRLKEDMKRFRELTGNSPIIMGSKTFNSLNNKPLPGRLNIVLTKQIKTTFVEPSRQLSFTDSIDYALPLARINAEFSNGIAWVIGGSQIYNLFLPVVNKLYLTVIDKKFYGDKTFPYVNFNGWKIESIEKVENEEIPYQFEVWSRK